VNSVEFLADQLRRAYEGEAWHGPSLREVLAGVTAEMASAKPIPDAHNIWELVMHTGAWINAVRRRLAGDPAELSPQEDWPPIDGGSEAAWQQTLAALDEEQKQLRAAISSLPEAGLKSGVAGAKYSVRFMLEGVIQHNLYHAGQIALLKKMA
jgi:uncharacterized damage-inducible protein DinB